MRKAWSFPTLTAVLARRRRSMRQPRRGPLHGVPVGIKDVIDTCDMPTEMGSPIYRGYRDVADASCVAKLRAAGALIFGKTVTCEFAGAAPAATTNPHDPRARRAAPRAGLPRRSPISWCRSRSAPRPAARFSGLRRSAALSATSRPSARSIRGVKPAAASLDTVGLMARTVEDVELAARVLTNARP